jgi:hypothetical protein
MKGIGIKSVKDVEALVKAKNVLHKPDAVSALESAWKQKQAETKDWVTPLTGKEKGQLRNFIKKCPPGKAPEIFRHALDKWIFFAKKVQTTAGHKSIKSQPDIGFLLIHAQAAVTFWEASKSVKVHEAAPICFEPKLQVTSKPPEPEPQPDVSWDELMSDPD